MFDARARWRARYFITYDTLLAAGVLVSSLRQQNCHFVYTIRTKHADAVVWNDYFAAEMNIYAPPQFIKSRRLILQY